MKIVLKDNQGVVFGDFTNLDCPLPRKGDKVRIQNLWMIVTEVRFELQLEPQRVSVILEREC